MSSEELFDAIKMEVSKNGQVVQDPISGDSVWV